MAPEVDLSAVGLGPVEQDAYRSLVVDGGGTADALAERWGRPGEEVRGLLAAMRDLELVEESTYDSEASRWYPTAPDVALRGLLNSRQHALSVAEASVARLTDIYRRDLHHAGVGDLVEVVLGTEAVRGRFLQLELGARSEVCAFVDARPVAVNPEDNQAEAQARGRGVRFRVVIERAALDHGATLAETRAAIGPDVLVRSVDAVPTKLLVVDGAVAMAPLAVRGHDAAAVVIRAPSLVHSLSTLFEQVWAGGIPVVLDASNDLVDGRAPGPDGVDVAVLSLVLSGLTDEAAGKQLGLSGRTVQRRLKVLMDLTGATSRLQLGWEASERGWVSRAAGARPPAAVSPAAEVPDVEDSPRVSGPRGSRSRLSESNRRPSHYE